MKRLIILCISIGFIFPASVLAAQPNHSHNHFNPKLEALGNDVIGLTVCYKNGFLSDQQQDLAFVNLIKYAGVSGEELGMYYMENLGQKAEQIMSDPEGSELWSQEYCHGLITSHSNTEGLEEAAHHPLDRHDHGVLAPEIVIQDIERGRLLMIQ